MSDSRKKTVLAADRLAMEIRSGELAHGTSFPSRRALCERFGISPMTAHKIQQTLLEMGLIRRQCGERFLVNCDRIPVMDRPEQLRRVCCILPAPRGVVPSRWLEAIDGCREACAKFGLEFRYEIYDCLEREENYVNTSRTAAPDEGYVAILMSRSTMREMLGLLLSPRTRIVLINSVFPERPSVLTDNRHGIGELLDCAQRHGAKKVMLAGCFAQFFPIVNESERIEAFAGIAPAMGLEWETDCSGNYESLYAHVCRFRPDALLFTRDRTALHFRTLFLPKLDFPLLCYGFDDIVEDTADFQPFTTYRVDCRAAGTRAVEMLMEPYSEFTAPLYARVRGKLLDRENFENSAAHAPLKNMKYKI